MTYRIRPAAAAAGLALGALCLAGTLRSTAAQPADPLSPPANGPRRPAPGWHALVGATLHPRPGETVDRATVVIRDGLIAQVLAPADDGAPAPAPAGATAWDCSGLHVYAGLIDAFVEVDAPAPDAGAPGAHWNRRVTPQRSALDGPGLDSRTARSLREMGFTAAAISPRTGTFRGSGAVVSLAEVPDRASDGRPPVYKAPAFHAVSFDTARGGGGSGRDPTDRWDSYPDSQMGAIALIRQTLSDAGWLAAGGTPSRSAPAAAPVADGVGAANCLVALNGAAPLLFDVGDELEVLRAAKIAREFGRPLIVVGGGTEFRRLEAIRADGPPLVVPLAFPEAPRVDSIGAAEEVGLRELMTWEQAPTNPRRLAAAGLTVALTTSKAAPAAGPGFAGRRGTRPPGTPVEGGMAAAAGAGESRADAGRSRFRDNLRKAIRHGLSEDDALAMLTTNPARILGVADVLGTIEPGKVANLVVADGPLFARATKVRDVWIDGQRHEVTSRPSPFEGTWRVTLEPGPARPGAITWEVRRGGEITIIKRPEGGGGDAADAGEGVQGNEGGRPIRARARSVRTDDAAGGPGRISFLFDHEPFGQPGVFTITGLLDGDEMHGDGTRADGARFKWTATRAGPARAEPGHNARGDGEPRDQQPGRAGDEPGGDDKPVTDVPERLGLPFGAYAMESPPEQPEVVVITGATIWTAGPQGKVDGGTMIVRRGKIERILASDPGDLVPRGEGGEGPPPGWVVIDGRGKHITPGIIDCHSHTGISKGVNEGGQAVTAEVRIEDVTNPDAIGWYRQLAGGVTTVNSLHGSANPIGGQNCVNKIRWGVVRPDDMHLEGARPGIKFALGENVKQSNFGDGSGTRYPRSRMGVEAIIRDRFTAAREYAAQWEEAATEPRRHEATKPRAQGAGHDNNSNLPRSHRVAEGDAVGAGGLPSDGIDAGQRTVRTDDPDAPGGGLSSVEHRGGPRTTEHGGVPEVPPDRPGFARGTGNPDGVGDQPEDAAAARGNDRVDQGNRPGAPGLDSLDPPRPALGAESSLRGSAAPSLRGSRPPPRRDLELEALAQVLDGTRLIHCHSYRQDEILMLCRLAQEFGFRLGTFQHNLEGYKVAREVGEAAIGASLFSDWWAYKVEVQDAIPYAGPIMHDAGVCVSYNSDSDELARRLNVEAGKAVKYGGLEAHEALRFVTLNPAKQLMLDHRLGSLEPGKDADFAVWSGPPLSSLSRCEATWIDGREYFSLVRDASMRERDARERQRIIQKILAEPGRGRAPGAAGRGGARGARPDAGPAEEVKEESPPPAEPEPPAWWAAADDGHRSGRAGLMAEMLRRAADRRREFFLDLYRRGIDPEAARCGDCGESMLLEGGAW
jgi:imidazolonepropionase-like amidohydrolase